MNLKPTQRPIRLGQDDNPGPYRVGSHWKVTVIYDPNYDPAATNAQHHGVRGEPAQRLH